MAARVAWQHVYVPYPLQQFHSHIALCVHGNLLFRAKQIHRVRLENVRFHRLVLDPITFASANTTAAVDWFLDTHRYDTETDTPALCRSTNLCQEMGQVEYIFSDKTGTLTRNVMDFKRCSIGGIPYGKDIDGKLHDKNGPIEGCATLLIPSPSKRKIRRLSKDATNDRVVAETFDDPRLLRHLHQGDEETDRENSLEKKETDEESTGHHANRQSIIDFMTIMSVCHTVVAEKDDDNVIQYQAESPDEGALVKAADKLGFSFSKRKH